MLCEGFLTKKLHFDKARLMSLTFIKFLEENLEASSEPCQTDNMECFAKIVSHKLLSQNTPS